jgi:hypothetical protein
MAVSVTFGGTPGTSVTVNSDTSLTVTTPGGAAGPVDVTVTTAGGSDTLDDGFTYADPAPTLTAVAPTTLPRYARETATFTGTNLDRVVAGDYLLGSAQMTGTPSTINGPFTLDLDSPTQGTVLVEMPITGGRDYYIWPAGWTGGPPSGAISGPVTIGIFAYDPMYTLTSLDPATGPVGTLVTVTGTNFRTDLTRWTVSVDPSGSAWTGPATVISPTELTFEIPAGVTAGTWDVSINYTDVAASWVDAPVMTGALTVT